MKLVNPDCPPQGGQLFSPLLWHFSILQCASIKAFPLLHHYGTFAAHDSLHLATRHPEASHANLLCISIQFSEAEHCILGVITNGLMICGPEGQQSGPFALAS
jgi:hypothetical protein